MATCWGSVLSEKAVTVAECMYPFMDNKNMMKNTCPKFNQHDVHNIDLFGAQQVSRGAKWDYVSHSDFVKRQSEP